MSASQHRCHTHRFTPSSRVIPGYAPDSYLCPVCKVELDRYQMRVDFYGVPRLVDCAGEPCPSCVEQFSAWSDDGR